MLIRSIVLTCMAFSAAGCGLEGLLGYLPSEEDLQAYNRQLEELRQRIESLPMVEVRIVNETDFIAEVEVTSAVQGPESPTLDLLELPFFDEGPYFETADHETILVAARGSADGAIRCGDVIAVSASAPYDGPVFSSSSGYGVNEDSPFGYLGSEGNIQWEGLGSDGASFEGDTITTIRYIQPSADGVDCETGALVITLAEPSTLRRTDPDTGELLESERPGQGTIKLAS